MAYGHMTIHGGTGTMVTVSMVHTVLSISGIHRGQVRFA